MKFYENQYFHIYNQGNRKQNIFFTNENYLFFLWKMRGYLLPFGDFISWCLMPNHFHWLFYVRKITIQRETLRDHQDAVEYQRRKLKYGAKALPVSHDLNRGASPASMVTLNEAIGYLERSYTRAINAENEVNGSLFRPKCKTKDGFIDDFITLNKLNGTLDKRFVDGNNYPYTCFNYIHNNPVVAGLVKRSIDYIWSSARDYADLRKGTLCNLEMGHQLINYIY